MAAIFYGAAFIGAILTLSILEWSWWLRFLGIVFFLLGYVASDYFLRYADGIPDIFALSSSLPPQNPCRKRRKHRFDDSKSSDSSSQCGVCGSGDCARGGDGCFGSVSACASGNGVLDPKIPKIIDDALQEFLDMTLKTYVEDWYETLISREDKAFLRQLRIHIRFALCQCLNRLYSIDLTHIILDELVPIAISHAAVYADVKRRNLEPSDLEDRVLDSMASKKLLHPAMRSRMSELAYLKRLTESVISFCADKSLSPTSLSFLRELLTFEVCLPAADSVADPDIVNRLLELFFDPSPMRIFDEGPSEMVAFLNRFVDEKNPNSLSDTVVFQTKLSEIIRDPPVLYVFMSYLKSVNAPMNWLQFVLSAHDIQEQLHSGRTLSKEDISHLHWQSWEIYRNYLHEGAPDKLGDDLISPSLADQLKSGVEAEPEKAITTVGPLLEQAYQIVYQHLQWRYVAPFCHSARFMELVCAARNRDGDEKGNMDTVSGLRTDADTSDNTGHQQLIISEDLEEIIRENCTPNSCSGSESGSDEEDSELLRQASLSENDVPAAPALRDLSQWKAGLPRIEPRRDPQTGRTMYVYVIEVEATDMESRRWCTDRRYREFYVLESKLVEFHGEQVLGGFPLPPKKNFNNKSRAFVESQRPIFDQFVKRLLHNPALKRSELLHAFLTSATELTASFLPDPFKVMRKMPGKLARERGQNLAPFLQSLVSSITSGSPNELRPPENGGRASPYPVGRTSPFLLGGSAGTPANKSLQDTLYGSLYKNNCDLISRSASAPFGKLDDILASAAVLHRDPCIVTGIYDGLILLAHKIFQISYLPWILFVSARVVIRRTFDSYVNRYLRRLLQTAMHERRLVLVVEALRDLVFGEEELTRGEEEVLERKQNAFRLAKQYLEMELDLIRHIVGEKNFDEGLKLIFDCLQYPRLNKQLFYVLLDAAVRDLFPELV